jgi:phosphate/sulfate permease
LAGAAARMSAATATGAASLLSLPASSMSLLLSGSARVQRDHITGEVKAR